MSKLLVPRAKSNLAFARTLDFQGNISDDFSVLSFHAFEFSVSLCVVVYSEYTRGCLNNSQVCKDWFFSILIMMTRLF